MHAEPLPKLHRRSLAATVFDELSRRILAQRLDPGTPLPTERALAEALGVNRGAVREAISRLVQEGLVDVRQGDGSRVADYPRRGGLALLGRMLLRADGRVDVEVARSVVEMRAALAPDAARWCALRRDDRVLARLDATLAAIRVAETVDERQRLSIELWDAVVTGSGNIAYRFAYNTLRETYEQMRRSLAAALAEEVGAIDDLAAMVEAIRARNPDEARARAHAVIDRGTVGLARILEALGGIR
jgi:DNA-binding FadR family transcriptional regulator